MQTGSRRRAVATPRQPQSVAALLPEEIVDSIFAQFGYDFSEPMWYPAQLGRSGDLSNMSVVAEGWTRPARRLLVKSVKVGTWAQLQKKVPGWAGKQVRELGINALYWERQTSEGAAGAVFKLLKQLPNLRRLRLVCLPFDSFNATDSTPMQPTVLLPHLRDLSILRVPSPQSIIFDLLATSKHQISRLSVGSTPAQVAPSLALTTLDFCGNLRFLSTETEFYRTLVDPRWIALEGLEGLEELQLKGIAPGSREGGEEDLYRIIAPTLSKLGINDADVTWFAQFLPLLTRLSRLWIGGTPVPDPAALLFSLPPSLAFLRLDTDLKLLPALSRWTATPSLVPVALKQIQIDYIYEFATYQQLPPVQTLSTNCRPDTVELLGRHSPGTLPFKTLEMFFHYPDLDRRSLVEAECARLGVVFRQRLETLGF